MKLAWIKEQSIDFEFVDFYAPIHNILVLQTFFSFFMVRTFPFNKAVLFVNSLKIELVNLLNI